MPKQTDKAERFWYYWCVIGGGREGYPWCEFEFWGNKDRSKPHARPWRFDFAWPIERLAVEIDGGQWQAHGGRHNTDADREKMNAAAEMGWRTIRFSTQMLERDPQACVEQVLRALGYEGSKDALPDR